MSTIAGAIMVCAMERRNKWRASTEKLPVNLGERLRTRRDVEDALRVGRPVVNVRLFGQPQYHDLFGDNPKGFHQFGFVGRSKEHVRVGGTILHHPVDRLRADVKCNRIHTDVLTFDIVTDLQSLVIQLVDRPIGTRRAQAFVCHIIVTGK